MLRQAAPMRDTYSLQWPWGRRGQEHHRGDHYELVRDGVQEGTEA